MKITSDFAILDVKKGRNKLLKHIDNGGVIEVVIRGTIDSCWSNDDGISREFQVDVTDVTLS